MTISTQRLRFLRGNSTAVAAFTGLQGELVFNTTTYTLHLQDGLTAGGYPLATSAQIANISANANYGNSNVSSYLASNSNILITSTGNIRTSANLLTDNYLAANAVVVGGNLSVNQHELAIFYANDTVSFLTGNRGSANSSIRIQANTSPLSGIHLRNDSGKIGFNTLASDNNSGYTFTFNGSVYSSEFYAEPNLPTGYQFATVDGDTGLSHVDYAGNLSAIRIRHAGDEVAKFYNNNTTELKGNLVVTDGVSFGTFPDAYMQIYGNVNSYQQIVAQNLSNNAAASTDFVATSDNGTDTQYFINMGINSSQFDQAGWFPSANTANEGYLYVVGYNAAGPGAANIGNLVIGSTNGVVKTFVGNTSDANVVTTVSTNLLTVSGNVNASYFIGNGSLLTGVTGGTNYSNTNVAAYLTVYNGSILTNTINFSDSTVQTTAWKAGGNSAFSSNSIFVNNVAAGNFNNNGDFNVVFDAYTGGPTLNFSASYQSPLNSNVGITVQAVNTPIVMSNANIELRSNLATTWTFDSNGAINLANNGVVRRQDSVNLVGNGYVQMQWIDTGNLNIADPNGTTGLTNWMWVDQLGLHIETNVNNGGPANTWEFLNNGNFASTGNIRLVTNDNLWNFDTNGSLTFPGNTLQIGLVGGNSGIRSDSANIVIDTTAAGGGQWNFISNGKLQSPNGGLIGAVDTNDVNSFGLKAGGSVNYVELNYGDDQRIYVDSAGSYIGTNNQSSQYLWSFRDDGWLTLPGSLSATGNITGANVVSANTFVSNAFNVVTAGNLSITSQYGLGFTGTILEDNGTLELIANGGGAVVVGWDSNYGNGLGNIATINFNEVGGEGILLRTGNRSATEYNWNFDNTGNLTLPGNTFSVNYANGTPVSLGGGSYGNANVATFLANYGSNTISTTGNIQAGNISASGNVIATGNANVLTLTTRNGDSNNSYASPQIIMGYAGTADYPSFIHTTHNASTPVDNTIEFWTSDGTQAGTFPTNAVLGLTVTNGNIETGNISATGANLTGNINASYFIGNGRQLTGITATANYNNSNVAAFLANIGSNTITTTGNITGNYFIGNGALLTGISASANYGNTNVAGFLGAYGSNTIVTTGNITAGYFIGNGSTLTGVTNYSNANAVSMLSTNTNVIIGNTNAYPLQSNITQVFIGNAVALTSGGNTQPTYTNLLNNLYYDAAGALRYRNTQTGAAQMSMGGSGGFTWSGTTSGVTANAASGMGLWATLTGSTLTTYNSINITASGNLLTTAGVLNTGAVVGYLYNTTASTVNMGGAATTIAMGASTSTTTLGSGNGNLTVGNISAGGNITVGNVIGLTSNTTITAGSYTTTFDNVGNVTVSGNLTINGVYAGYAPARAAMRVYGNTSTNYTAGTTISNQVIDYNQGSYYNNTTGLFTAPIAGLYHCYATVRVGNNNALNQAALLKNGTLSGSNVVAFWETDTNTGTATHFSITGYAKCVANDTISLKVIAGNVQFDSNDSWGVTYIG